MKRIFVAAVVAVPILLLADMDRCVSCHGVDFEKKALGVSKIVKNMSEEEIKASIDGYKRGEGGPMKAIMIKEVNLGVNTDAMAADVYHEAHTKGFEVPDSEFIFKKRRSEKILQQIKKRIKSSKSEKEFPKVATEVKSSAFTMYAYDKFLRENVKFDNNMSEDGVLNLNSILERVSSIKVCVDHSFSEDEMVKCRVDFVNLADSIVLDEVKKMKSR